MACRILPTFAPVRDGDAGDDEPAGAHQEIEVEQTTPRRHLHEQSVGFLTLPPLPCCATAHCLPLETTLLPYLVPKLSWVITACFNPQDHPDLCGVDGQLMKVVVLSVDFSST